MREREAFQELDYRAVFGIDGQMGDRDRRARAHPRDRLARLPRGDAGPARPGRDRAARGHADRARRASPMRRRVEPVETWPGLADMAQLQKMLWAAERPIVLLGGSRWSEARGARWRALPSASTCRSRPRFRRADAVRCRPSQLRRRCRHRPQPEAARAGQGRRPAAPGRRPARRCRRQSYTLLDIPAPADAGACPSRRRGTRPRLPCARLPSTPRRPPSPRRWRACSRPRPSAGPGRPRPPMRTSSPGPTSRHQRAGRVATWARSWPGCATSCRADAIVCNGAGNYAIWVHRFHRFRRFGTQLAPTSRLDGLRRAGGGRRQALLPRAHGRLLRRRRLLPDERPGIRHRRAVRPAGDHRGRSTTACTAPSACTRSGDYPGRVSATALKNPDFAAYARAFGGYGETVEKTADFAAAFERAQTRASRRSSIVKIDPEAITPVDHALRDPRQGAGGKGLSRLLPARDPNNIARIAARNGALSRDGETSLAFERAPQFSRQAAQAEPAERLRPDLRFAHDDRSRSQGAGARRRDRPRRAAAIAQAHVQERQ